MVVLRHYKIDVSYNDQEGTRHNRVLRIGSFWKQIWWSRNAPPEVRYDPGNPRSIALDWSQKLGWARWVAIPATWIIPFLLGAIFAAYYIAEIRKWGKPAA